MKKLQITNFLITVDKILKNPFYLSIKNKDECRITPTNMKNWPNYFNHNHTTIDAFILNFRYLILKKDKISIFDIKEFITTHNMLSDDLSIMFKKFDTYKDRKWYTKIMGTLYSNGEVFDIMFYGGMAHFNQEKIEQYSNVRKSLIGDQLTYVVVKNYFLNVINIAKKERLLLKTIINKLENNV